MVIVETDSETESLPGSPLLHKTEVNYEPVETPLPSISSSDPDSSDSDSDSSSENPCRHHRSRKWAAKPSRGAEVLIKTLAPDLPEIAREAGKGVLRSQIDDSLDSDDSSIDDDRALKAQATAADALRLVESSNSSSKSGDVKKLPPIIPQTTFSYRSNDVAGNAFPADSHNSTADDQSSPPCKLSGFQNESDDNLRQTDIASPLQKYAITDTSSNEALPPMQTTPLPNSANSPEGLKQQLPSIQSTLAGALAEPKEVTHRTSRDLERGSFSAIGVDHTALLPSQYQPTQHTSFSITSPVGSATGYSPYYQGRRISKSSVFNGEFIVMSPISHQSSPIGPSSEAVSNDQTPTNATPSDHGVGHGSGPSYINGPVQPNGPLNSTGFKCPYPGCPAPPFQTQYLLNSHANVHSQDRPHYCPVRGCPRALGGKGFKRKNEMNRHAYVHNSPGYACPFCTDHTHKYPRPDNLQRHVRVNHHDKDRDDPALRLVLARRAGGGTRGRRRRLVH